MKYLLVTLEYLPFRGGVASYYANLVSHSRQKIEVLDNSRQLLLNDWPILPWLAGWWHLLKMQRREKYNYILVGQVLPLGTIVWLLSYFFSFRYCVFFHGLDLAASQTVWRKRWLTRRIIKRAHRLVAGNSRTAGELKNILSKPDWRKVMMINPGVDHRLPPIDWTAINDLKKRYHLENKIILLTVGRLVKRKGHDLVLLALAKEHRPDIVYVIIGSGPEEAALRRLIEQKDLSRQVVLLTDVDESQKHLWLQASDIFIMVSRDDKVDYEGFGIVYLEAGLRGKPVIAGRGGGVADAVVDNQTGLLVDAKDLSSIAQAIESLSAYEGLRHRLGAAGKARALKCFTWNKQAEKFWRLLNAKA